MEHNHGSLLSDPRFWVAASFTIFFVIFGRKFWLLLTGMLDKRAVAIQAELDEASRLRIEAESLLNDAKTRREAALQEAAAMLENARREAARVGDMAREEAASAAVRRERMAHDRISAAEQAAIAEVRLAAVELATSAAKEVIAQSFSAEPDSAIIDQAIRNLPAALSGRRAA